MCWKFPEFWIIQISNLHFISVISILCFISVINYWCSVILDSSATQQLKYQKSVKSDIRAKVTRSIFSLLHYVGISLILGYNVPRYVGVFLLQYICMLYRAHNVQVASINACTFIPVDGKLSKVTESARSRISKMVANVSHIWVFVSILSNCSQTVIAYR